MALSQATITVYCQICINIYTRCRISKKKIDLVVRCCWSDTNVWSKELLAFMSILLFASEMFQTVS